MVDGIVAPGPDGAPVWQPRPAEELETLRQLVQTAVGFDAARGDTVTLETLQFSEAAGEGTLAERSGGGFLATWGAQLAQLGVLGAIVLALIVFVLRPMLSRQPPVAIAELTGPEPASPRQLGGPAGEILDLPPQSASKIDRLREVITARTEDSAAVLRTWIEAPDPRKETAGS
jgi:flagellar M-ring protein FliF